MPSTLHEVLIELFRHRPPLAAELLTDPFDIKLPAWDKVSVLSSDFSELVDTEHATLYAGVVLSALPAAIRSQLEALMTTATGQYRDYLSPFVNRFVDQGRAEGEALGEARGEARGEAKALLTMLAARGIELPEAATSRIAECADVDQLEEWVRRAATVGSADELFTESNAPEG